MDTLKEFTIRRKITLRALKENRKGKATFSQQSKIPYFYEKFYNDMPFFMKIEKIYKFVEKRFITFLKEYGVYDLYIKNLDPTFMATDMQNNWGSDKANEVKNMFLHGADKLEVMLYLFNCNRFLYSAFLWEHTEQGHDFWAHINLHWHDECSDLKKQIFNEMANYYKNKTLFYDA